MSEVREPGTEPLEVGLGTSVVIEDLDDGSVEEFVVVAPPESNPGAGRLSAESPVGRAITGRRRGEVVDARAPRRTRHLRISDVRAERPARGAAHAGRAVRSSVSPS